MSLRGSCRGNLVFKTIEIAAFATAFNSISLPLLTQGSVIVVPLQRLRNVPFACAPESLQGFRQQGMFRLLEIFVFIE